VLARLLVFVRAPVELAEAEIGFGCPARLGGNLARASTS
jgi:hypothetical protein